MGLNRDIMGCVLLIHFQVWDSVSIRSFIFAILLHIFWESFFATLIELWKNLDLAVFEGILAGVSHSVEELCIFTS